MSETVFVLGAGASKEAGAPVMADFLDRAYALSKETLDKRAKASLDLVFRARDELQRVHSKAQLDLDNVESVFAAFEMAQVLGLLGSLGESEIRELPDAMRTAIVTTLEKSIRLNMEMGRVPPPNPYGYFAGLLSQLLRKRRSVCVITLNYDLCLDYALNFKSIGTDYCLGPSENPAAVKLLKLHGSLNWTTCSGCHKTVAWHLKDYLKQFNWLATPGASTVVLEVASRIGSFQHCPMSPAEGTVIVPPTWNKIQYHKDIEPVWRAAAKELSDAENVFIAGYSLPPTDQFFRYFYALASAGPARLRQFHVYDPEPSVEGKFRSILGPQAAGRFRFSKSIFNQALPDIAARLGIDPNAIN